MLSEATITCKNDVDNQNVVIKYFSRSASDFFFSIKPKRLCGTATIYSISLVMKKKRYLHCIMRLFQILF